MLLIAAILLVAFVWVWLGTVSYRWCCRAAFWKYPTLWEGPGDNFAPLWMHCLLGLFSLLPSLDDSGWPLIPEDAVPHPKENWKAKQVADTRQRLGLKE